MEVIMSAEQYEKICKVCRNNSDKKWIYKGYYFCIKKPQDNKCLYCGNELEDIILTEDEVWDIYKISPELSFLEAMINLKEKDPVEFQLRMKQFRIQTQQHEQIRAAKEEDSKPHCPHCHSTNIKSISGLSRGTSIAIWGIISKKINKSFECNNCGYTW